MCIAGLRNQVQLHHRHQPRNDRCGERSCVSFLFLLCSCVFSVLCSFSFIRFSFSFVVYVLQGIANIAGAIFRCFPILGMLSLVLSKFV